MNKNKRIKNAVIIIGLFIGIYFLGNKIIYDMEIKNIEKQLSEYLEPKFDKIKITVVDETVNDEIVPKVYTLNLNTLKFNPWDESKRGAILEGGAEIGYIALGQNDEVMYIHNIRMGFKRDDSESDFHINWRSKYSGYSIKEFSRDIMNKAVNNELFKYEKFIADKKNKNNPKDEESKKNRNTAYEGDTAMGKIYFEGGDVTFDRNGNVIVSDMFRMIDELTGTKAVMSVVCEDDLMEFAQGKDSQGITIYIKKKAPIGNPLWNVSLEDVEVIDISYSEKGLKNYYKEFEVEEKVKIEQIYEVIKDISVDSITTEDMNKLSYDENKFVRVSLKLKENGLLGFQINKNGIFFDDFIGVKSKEEGDHVLKLIEQIVEQE